MHPATTHAPAKARHAEQRRQARRDELARAARSGRRAPRQLSTRLVPGLPAIVTAGLTAGVVRRLPSFRQPAGNAGRSQHRRAAT
jgi:hypothetical protein